MQSPDISGKKLCINCRYSETVPEMAAHGMGICRKRPPTASPFAMSGRADPSVWSAFPNVRLTHDWCGEFDGTKILAP